MLTSLLTAALLLLAQEPPQMGIITGAVAAPAQEISEPLQIILLSPRYVDIWTSEVQKRLDRYWQQFQPTFRNRKEYFTEFSKEAHKDATLYVLTRMNRDSSSNLPRYSMEIPAGGNFEFKNIPFGEYKVLAIGRVGKQIVMWQETVDVRSSIPHFLELKKRVP